MFLLIAQQMSNFERDNELQKSPHILVFDWEKGKWLEMKMYSAQKTKGVLSKLKYKKFRHRSQNEMFWS